MFALFLASMLVADTTPPDVVHDPPRSVPPFAELAVEAEIVDDADIFDPVVSLRLIGDVKYVNYPMQALDGIRFRAVVPGSKISGDFEYFIEAWDSNGNGPARSGSPSRPHRVTLSAPPPPPPLVARPARVEDETDFLPPPPLPPPVASPPAVAPTMTAPAVTAPAVTAPAVTAPAVTAPAVTAPAVTAPVVTAPAVTAPAVTAPAVPAPAVRAPPKGRPFPVAPVITLVAGLAAVAAGGLVYLGAASEVTAVDARYGPGVGRLPSDAALVRSAQERAFNGSLVAAAGSALAVGGLVWLVLPSPGGGSGVQVGIGGRF